MFDSVGRQVDPEGARRKAGAMLLTTGLFGLGGFFFALAAYVTVEHVLAPDPVDEPMFEVAMVDPAQQELVAPPPPAMSRGEVRAENAEPQPVTSDTPTEDPQPLKTEVVDRVTAPVGDPNGKEDGDPNGELGGTGKVVADRYCEGDACGGGGTGDGPPVRSFNHNELEIKRQSQPRYPVEAEALGLGEVRCVATVWIDPQGVPYRVSADACPAAFQAETQRALRDWRWYPPKVDRKPVHAQTKIAITYRLK